MARSNLPTQWRASPPHSLRSTTNKRRKFKSPPKPANATHNATSPPTTKKVKPHHSALTNDPPPRKPTTTAWDRAFAASPDKEPEDQRESARPRTKRAHWQTLMLDSRSVLEPRPAEKRNQKKTISTSRIFKKPRLDKAARRSKQPPHPLSTTLDEALEDATAHIETRSSSSLAGTHERHLNALEAMTEKYTGLAEDAREYVSGTLLAPLSEERYILGKGKEAVTLGERMEGFKSRLYKGLEVLDKLWGEWEGVQTRLMEEFEEATAEESDEEEREYENLETFVRAEMERAVNQMRDSEKDLDLHQQAQKQKIYIMMMD